MLLERTLSQLDIGHVSEAQAMELGQLGYIQWLGSLPGKAPYRPEAMRAAAMAAPFAQTSPAVAVFCNLLVASVEMPPTPLSLLPIRQRRGGSRARRAAT